MNGDKIVEIPTLIEFTKALFEFIENLKLHENFKLYENIKLERMEIQSYQVFYFIEIDRIKCDLDASFCENNLLEFSRRFNDIHTKHTCSININIY
jgi:hypothetical protein